MENRTVLFVDDEKYIIRALKKLLKSEAYESIFASSGEEALSYLANQTVDAVIVDSRMPGMDGVELLEKVKALYPEVTRVSLCGLTESRLMNKIVDRDIAKLYIFKPWDDLEMKRNIRGILETKAMLIDQHLMKLLNKLDALPSLPQLYYDISELIDKGADITEVGAIVEKDQAISSKVLKLANSAFYGRKTGDLSQAIMGIGLNNLKHIVLTTSLFKGPPEVMQEVELLWQHAVNTNVLTHMIYDKGLKKKMPSIYGSAGLLHDIGKLILHLFCQADYQKLLTASKEGDDSLVEYELEHLHVTHQDLGGYLLNAWELPFAYVEAAMFHHRPSDARVINHELVAVVHLANYYSLTSLSPDGTTNYLDPSVFNTLNLTPEKVEQLVEEMKVNMA